MKERILAYIPARAGSKRIPGKNIKSFFGRPLIAYAIEQALSCRFIDRVIVDTDSPKIARVARKHGAEVPFLRPKRLGTGKTQVLENIKRTLWELKKREGYIPDYLLILQTTSPLREKKDIEDCVKLMQKGGADSVVTVAPTHPRLYHLTAEGYLKLANKKTVKSSNTQDWPAGYLLNGCMVYFVKTKTLFREKTVLPAKTKAVITPKWRSVDLDTPEDWALAEFLYPNKAKLAERIRRLYGKK